MTDMTNTKQFLHNNKLVIDNKESSGVWWKEIPQLAYQINETLKHSEKNKKQALEQMICLFQKLDTTEMGYDYWRQLIEEYLKDPFLSTKNMYLEWDLDSSLLQLKSKVKAMYRIRDRYTDKMYFDACTIMVLSKIDILHI